ncbi:cadherin-like beta sandwich domain-containing protein [Oscillospiraceae bacterium PP1C4]
MKRKRGLAFLLAGIMLVTSFSQSVFIEAATNNKLMLSYTEGKQLQATVISGDSVEVKASNTGNYALKPNEAGLKIRDTNQLPVVGGFSVSRLSKGTSTEDYFNVSTQDQSGQRAASGFYTIISNYNAMQDTASTKQVEGFSKGSGGTMASLNGEKVSVSEKSVARLTFKGGSDFELSYDESTAGVFKNWSKAVSVLSNKPGSSAANGQEIQLQFWTEEGRARFFTFKPNAYTIYYKKDTAGNDLLDSAGNKIVEYTDYNIKTGDAFEIIFNYEVSGDLGLTVEDPLKVLQDVAKNATDYNQKLPSEYVVMQGQYNDFNFITDNLKLRGIYEMYNRKINLKWTWTPNDPNEGGEKEIGGFLNPEWKTFSIERKEYDVPGKLTVVTSFSDATFYAVPPDKLPTVTKSVPIIIRGTGTPTVLTKLSYITGLEGSKDYTDTTFPTSTFVMDMYKGEVPNYDAPKDPYQAVFHIKTGTGNAFPRKILITATDPNVVTAMFKKGTGVQQTYTFGREFLNEDDPTDPRNIDLELSANKAGTTKLKFQFLINVNGKDVEDVKSTRELTVQVKNTSPDGTAELSKVLFQDNNKKDIPGFAFAPTTYNYGVYEIPYSAEHIKITPTPKDTSQKIMGISVEMMNESALWEPVSADVWNPDSLLSGKDWVENWPFKEGDTKYPSLKSNSLTNGSATLNLKQCDVDRQIKITIKVRAQNPNITQSYVFTIKRVTPSADSSLKNLQMFDTADKNLLTDFKPDVLDYKMEVPFSTDMLRVAAEANHTNVKEIKYEPELAQRVPAFGDKDWLKFEANVPKKTLFITVIPENGLEADKSVYSVEVTRKPPSTIATLDDIKVADALDKELNFTPKFNKDTDTYELSIPYSTEKIKLLAKPTDLNATMQLKQEDTVLLDSLKAETFTKALEIPHTTEAKPYYEMTILVTAEDGKVEGNLNPTQKAYKLQVTRAEPSTDATLSSLKIADQDGKEIDYEFYPEGKDYQISVPYEVEKVVFTPTSNYAAVKTITVDGKKVQSGNAAPSIKLTHPDKKTVEVVVTAEDGITVMTYKVTFTKLPPSSDARLISLNVANTAEFKPVFAPSKTSYSAKMAEGAKGVTVTATTNHPSATITVDGKKAASGKATELINVLEVNQSVTVVVTAQDRKTTMTYVVSLYNGNLVEKSSNADLSNLTVNYGAMTPYFKSSITTYEVAAKEDTYSVDIIPKPADRMATVKVFSGTKEIGDEDGNYSDALVDGENEFNIKVTSPDKTKTKEYALTVYRNEEDKMKTLKPITAEDIDFEESDVIIVDISKYSRVSADVFNELKKYPKKQIIFQGNDYSLQFNASDIKKVIPHTQTFDFALSYESPLEDEIWDIIDSRRGNDDARVVMVYFNHHGQLPAPATFTLSLKDRYRNEKLFWHYYNEERERIDYYGYVRTNSRGTFTVTLDHCSTYLLVDQRLSGSENKSISQTSDGVALDADGKKINPNTGRSGGRQ